MRTVRSKTLIDAYRATNPLPQPTGFIATLNAEVDHAGKYRMINRIDDSYTHFDAESNRWKFEKSTTSICPLFRINALTDLLISYSRTTTQAAYIVEKLLVDRRQGQFSMCLCSGITFVCEKKDCGMDTFRVYGTPSYGKSTVRGVTNPRRVQSRYDAVEVDFSPEINICQVMAIFAIFDTRYSKPIKFLMLVTPLKRIEKVGTDRLLPYSLMGYDLPPYYTTVQYHLIEPSAVLRPCILVPDHDRRWNYSSVGTRYLSQRRYWAITYSTTDRGFGYGFTNDVNSHRLPLLPPQRPPSLSDMELDNIFAQARAGTTGDYESEDDSSAGEDSDGED
jgi:hypothetical protein